MAFAIPTAGLLNLVARNSTWWASIGPLIGQQPNRGSWVLSLTVNNLSTSVLPVKLFEDMSPCAENRNLIVAFPDETCVLQVLSLVSHLVGLTCPYNRWSHMSLQSPLEYVRIHICLRLSFVSHILANRMLCHYLRTDRTVSVWIEFRMCG